VWQASASLRVCVISALVLVPCFWQSHIQAGDLSSHLYNAWLSILIGEGKAPGLTIVPQWTNVLFDWMLSGLMRLVGPWWAEHIAVPLLVLNFFWGAFALVCVVSRRRPWYILAFLAMLAHGWAFHMGFMNFYLAMGLSFWAFALLWNPAWKSILCAAPLLALACTAHALPVVWTVGATLYAAVARRLRGEHRIMLACGALASLAAVSYFLMTRYPHRWIAGQILTTTGADQLSVFGVRYYPLALLLVGIWLSLFSRMEREHFRVSGIPLQICLVTSGAALLIPSAVLLPQAHHALAFINDRASLFVAVMVCALLGQATARDREKTVIAVLMGLFFSFLYVDTRALDRIETLTEASVSKLPANARVVSALCDSQTVINPLAHVVDRPCIGRCFSFANYEPSTAWFRIRALPGNPIVVSRYSDSDALQNGTYVLRETDAPIYQVYLRDGYLDTRLLGARDVARNTCFDTTPSLKNVFRGHGNAAR
jgi:hypothetical protein